MGVGSTTLTHSPPLPASFRAEKRTVCASQEEARLEQEELSGCYRSPGPPWAAACSRTLLRMGRARAANPTSGAARPARRPLAGGCMGSRSAAQHCHDGAMRCAFHARAVRRQHPPRIAGHICPRTLRIGRRAGRVSSLPSVLGGTSLPRPQSSARPPRCGGLEQAAPVRQLGRSHWYQQSALPLHLQQAPPSPLTASPADRGAADAFPETSRLAANRCGNFRRGVTARLSRSRPVARESDC